MGTKARATPSLKYLAERGMIRKDKDMKIYENPVIDIEMLTSLDIIRTSDVGTELPPQDETDANWA